MRDKNKTVIIIAGPTAVGKTASAISIARHFNTEIISADSRQCYKELNIGVARPSDEELSVVPHYFIASHSIHEKVTAATFEQYALEKAAILFQQHDNLVMVGGTGLYIKAFCEGMDEIPEVPETIRNGIIEDYYAYGLTWLQQQVQSVDPGFYAIAEVQNPHRLMRALEVYKATGNSIMHYRKGAVKERDFNVIKIALHLPKDVLVNRINTRVDDMIKNGLGEEVRSLLSYQHLSALQTVGYKEMFDYYHQKQSLAQTIEEIKKNTRHYAKRQLTWFRKDVQYSWYAPDDLTGIKNHIHAQLAQV